MDATLFPRKFNIGQLVRTKSGIVMKVIGSALYGVIDGKVTPLTYVEYRLEHPYAKRTLYRKENELKEVK